MVKRNWIWTWFLATLALCLLVVLSACSVFLPAQTMVDIQKEVSAAVEATLESIRSETRIALAAAPSNTPAATKPAEPTASATPDPTSTPEPTATPVTILPTETLPPTATATPVSNAGQEIYADVDTNCRLGPSTLYKVDGYLLHGDSSQVYGRNESESWWYISNPSKEDKYCWVWSSTTNVEGDTSDLPVITSPPAPRYSTSYWGHKPTCEWQFVNIKGDLAAYCTLSYGHCNQILLIESVNVNKPPKLTDCFCQKGVQWRYIDDCICYPYAPPW